MPAKTFPLVELLVAVTIIVILLAMLVPALGRAIYHARQAQCAGRLRSPLPLGEGKGEG